MYIYIYVVLKFEGAAAGPFMSLFILSPFLQVLNILTRIIKGAVEIVVPVQKVGTSEASLLAKLETKLTFALWRIITLLH